MNEIERMAREAGCFTPGASRNYWAVTDPALARFAELVRAAERERCAKLCESARDSIWEFSDPAVKETAHNVCTNLAAAIRGN